jgi:hypothetical protein
MAWWGVGSLGMPGGTSLPYNAMTVDIFPSWAARGKGIPTRAVWNKVRPDADVSAHVNRFSTIREVPRIDTVKPMELITK